MAQSRSVVLVTALVVALLVVVNVPLGGGVAPGRPATVQDLSDAQWSGDLRFAADVHPLDRGAVRDAIARARPEARRLIDLVDGAVTVDVGPTGYRGASGYTERRDGAYDVVLDLAAVSRRLGERGVTRLVLHELGHVVDDAVVPVELDDRLDAAIPRGYACEPGRPDAGCSPRVERFAETFAKWATGDIGVGLFIGYRVPPPYSLEGWGEPLSDLRG